MALHLLSLIAKRSVPCVITDGGELRLLSKLVFAGLVEAQFDPDDQGALRRSSAQTATVTAITRPGAKRWTRCKRLPSAAGRADGNQAPQGAMPSLDTRTSGAAYGAGFGKERPPAPVIRRGRREQRISGRFIS